MSELAECKNPKYIYVITNNVNQKKYVGRTKNPENRFKAHMFALKSRAHYNKLLQMDFDKYGEEAFSMEVVDYGNNLRMGFHETRWITFLQTYKEEYGYNTKEPSVKNFENDGSKVYIDDKQLKEIISKKGYTYSFIAKRLGKDTDEIKRIINAGKISLWMLYKICRLLEISEEETELLIIY